MGYQDEFHHRMVLFYDENNSGNIFTYLKTGQIFSKHGVRWQAVDTCEH